MVNKIRTKRFHRDAKSIRIILIALIRTTTKLTKILLDKKLIYFEFTLKSCEIVITKLAETAETGFYIYRFDLEILRARNCYKYCINTQFIR